MITVQAPRSLFPTLYSGAAKAVSIGQSFARWLGSARRLPLRILCATLDDERNALLVEEPGAPVDRGSLRRVSVPPTNVWCVCTDDNEVATGAAEMLMAWWREAGGTSALPALWTGTAVALERRLLDRALAEIGELHQRNVALQRSLSALRDEWASVARIPPEIIELLENLRLSQPRVVFASSGFEGETVVPIAEQGPSGSRPFAVLAQLLPAWSRGLAGIDMHVAQGASGNGMLLASLLAIDGNCVLADWQIPFGHLRPGWLPLRFPTALDRPYRTLELRLWRIGAGDSPRLSLAPTGLLDEFAISIGSGAEIGSVCGPQMLAVRIWGGLPGAPWDAPRDTAGRSLRRELSVSVPDHVVARVHATRRLSPPFVWFGGLPDGEVLLHPVRNKVAAACIALPATSALCRVNCEAAMEDLRRRTPIACKLVIAVPETTVDQAENDQQVLASSGWIVLDQPRSPTPLSAPLARLHFGPVNLHLFTRVADAGPDYYGRTVFSRFELRMDSEAPWQMPPILPSSRYGGEKLEDGAAFPVEHCRDPLLAQNEVAGYSFGSTLIQSVLSTEPVKPYQRSDGRAPISDIG